MEGFKKGASTAVWALVVALFFIGAIGAGMYFFPNHTSGGSIAGAGAAPQGGAQPSGGVIVNTGTHTLAPVTYDFDTHGNVSLLYLLYFKPDLTSFSGGNATNPGDTVTVMANHSGYLGEIKTVTVGAAQNSIPVELYLKRYQDTLTTTVYNDGHTANSGLAPRALGANDKVTLTFETSGQSNKHIGGSSIPRYTGIINCTSIINFSAAATEVYGFDGQRCPLSTSGRANPTNVNANSQVLGQYDCADDLVGSQTKVYQIAMASNAGNPGNTSCSLGWVGYDYFQRSTGTTDRPSQLDQGPLTDSGASIKAIQWADFQVGVGAAGTD